MGKSLPKSARSQSDLSSNWKIEQLPGLDAEDVQKLKDCDIKTTQQLLRRTTTPAQKHILATQLQIHIQHVNKWAAMADLAQIPAVGCQYCGLLLHTGICCPAQLAETSLHLLHKQVLRFYVATLQRQDLCPPKEQLVEWIQQARLFVINSKHEAGRRKNNLP
nr:DUF4332 domain-containing protein [Kovacikia minuta]